MKKVLVTAMLVLAIASLANAGMLISYNGATGIPDSQIFLKPSETATLGIVGDGLTEGGAFYFGLQGPGSVSISGATLPYAGNSKDIGLDLDLPEVLGVNSPVVVLTLTDLVAPPLVPAPLNGLLVDGILFHCDGPGDVTAILFDGIGNVLDTLIIHQADVPEPMTIGLLGLGGLFLRRKMA